MIKYEAGRMGLLFIMQCTGSVFPKALAWAIPNAILAVILHTYARQEQVEGNSMSMNGVDMLWGGYTSVLGFLVVFRNNQAYTRFWEGATLINQVRGEWFNAVSTLFAFCNHAPEYQEQVDQFQHTLVRLASMLYCSALQQVCDLSDDCLEIIEIHSMDQESIRFMQESNDRCEVLLQWMQRLIVDAHEANVVKIAPPLLTRAFQELSRGVVNLNNARKIKDIPFPFPYAQMITCMLIIHWVFTPVMASQMLDSRAATGVVCFLVTFSFWCLIYIALEIDQPFGEDANDLPIRDMQKDFNFSLLTLMHPLAQKAPNYVASKEAVPSLKASLSQVIDGLHQPADVHHLERMMGAVAMSAASLRCSTLSQRSDECRSTTTSYVDQSSPTYALHRATVGNANGGGSGSSIIGRVHSALQMAGRSVVTSPDDSVCRTPSGPAITTTPSEKAYRECCMPVRQTQARQSRRIEAEATPGAPPAQSCAADEELLFSC